MTRKSSRKNIVQQILDKANLQDECIPGNPVVELLGDSRILIENHRGIVEYTRNCIRIRVCYGTLGINGGNLKLRQMTAGRLLITGKIDSIDVKRV